MVGRPDPIHGEEVVAFVSLRPGAEATPEELVAWARQRIGGYKYPREIHVVDAVPLTNVGKVDRKALRMLLRRCAEPAVRPRLFRWPCQDSNLGVTDYESAALPAELQGRDLRRS